MDEALETIFCDEYVGLNEKTKCESVAAESKNGSKKDKETESNDDLEMQARSALAISRKNLANFKDN